ADGAQSSRVPVPLLKDPYKVIRQAYLVRTNNESKPFEGKARTPESSYIVAPPTCHVEELEGSSTSGARSTSSDSTAPLSPDHPLTHATPALVPILHRTARMVVRVLSAMSHGLSAGIAEVAAMSDSTFRKRFRSSYDSSPSPTLLVRKRYREDEGPTAEDEDPAAGDEGLAAGVEGPGVDDESYGLDDKSHEEEAVLGGQQQEAPVVMIVVSAPLGLGYGALRNRELALEGDHVYSTFEVGHGFVSALEPERSERVSASRQPTLTMWIDSKDGIVYIDVPIYLPPAPPVQTSPSPEWTSGLLPISPSPSVVPSPVSSPMIPLTIPSPIASPMATSIATIPVNEDQFIEYRSILQDHTQREDCRDVWSLMEAHAGIRGMGLAPLQEMRGRVIALEQERDRRER
nr:hypothetical protein [Tanacetum cinerariifolium]